MFSHDFMGLAILILIRTTRSRSIRLEDFQYIPWFQNSIESQKSTNYKKSKRKPKIRSRELKVASDKSVFLT